MNAAPKEFSRRGPQVESRANSDQGGSSEGGFGGALAGEEDDDGGGIAERLVMGTRGYLNHLLYRRRKLGGE
jgi:hypothetical protein